MFKTVIYKKTQLIQGNLCQKYVFYYKFEDKHCFSIFICSICVYETLTDKA